MPCLIQLCFEIFQSDIKNSIEIYQKIFELYKA